MDTVGVEVVAVVGVTIQVKDNTRGKVSSKVKSTTRAIVMMGRVVVAIAAAVEVTEVVEAMGTARVDSHVGTVVMFMYQGTVQHTTSCATTARKLVTLPGVAILKEPCIMWQIL